MTCRRVWTWGLRCCELPLKTALLGCCYCVAVDVGLCCLWRDLRTNACFSCVTLFCGCMVLVAGCLRIFRHRFITQVVRVDVAHGPVLALLP
jgi:hypothetical protein